MVAFTLIVKEAKLTLSNVCARYYL